MTFLSDIIKDIDRLSQDLRILKKLLKDKNMDEEIRIKSYLQIRVDEQGRMKIKRILGETTIPKDAVLVPDEEGEFRFDPGRTYCFYHSPDSRYFTNEMT
jgi:hypothetical protein